MCKDKNIDFCVLATLTNELQTYILATLKMFRRGKPFHNNTDEDTLCCDLFVATDNKNTFSQLSI